MEIDLPIDLQNASGIIPMPYNRLKKWLSRHKALFPARYRCADQRRRRVRWLYWGEVKAIQRMTTKGHLESLFHPNGDLR